MNRTDLINTLYDKTPDLSHKDVQVAVGLVIDRIKNSVASGDNVEIRGFGSFVCKTRAAYAGKHPKTLKKIVIAKRYLPFFKAGKILKKEIEEIDN